MIFQGGPVFIAYVRILTCRSIYLQPYLQELSNLTGCIMETLHFSYLYADIDGFDKCMRAGSLKTSLPLDCTSTCIIYIIIF